MRTRSRPRRRSSCAFTADKDDRGEWPLEGNYYLALLEGPAYVVPEAQVSASDQFEAGWLVVDDGKTL